jgi:hypothetical protein
LNRIVAVSRFLTVLCLAAAVAAMAAPSPPVAHAVGGGVRIDGERGVRHLPLPDGTFELSWVHSVERTEWRETFRVDREGNILLVASEFASAGAGLPDRAGEGETFRIKDGRMRIEERNVPVGVLRVRLSDVSRHILWAGDRRFDLNAAFGEGVVTIRAEP